MFKNCTYQLTLCDEQLGAKSEKKKKNNKINDVVKSNQHRRRIVAKAFDRVPNEY